MIRAKIKNSKGFIYIYQIYYQERYEDYFCWHFLVSTPMTLGLKVKYLEEVFDIEIIKNQKKEKITNLFEYKHPIIESFLDEDWELYNDIIEGVEEAWMIFEEKLGHRP